MPVKHAFTSAKSDGGDATLIRPSNWNADHTGNTTPTFVVAATDSSARDIALADYICDGTADDVQIQAAIDALPSRGGMVVLCSGLFTIAAGLSITVNKRIRIWGPGAVISIPAGIVGLTINQGVVTTRGVIVEDVRFYGGTLGTNTAVAFVDTNWSGLYRVTIEDCATGILMHSSTANKFVEGITLEDVVIRTPTTYGIELRRTSGTNSFGQHRWAGVSINVGGTAIGLLIPNLCSMYRSRLDVGVWVDSSQTGVSIDGDMDNTLLDLFVEGSTGSTGNVGLTIGANATIDNMLLHYSTWGTVNTKITNASTRDFYYRSAEGQFNAATATSLWGIRRHGDTLNRFQVETLAAGGKLSWGTGGAAVDTNLYRSAASVLSSDDKLDPASLNVQVKAGTPVDGDVVGGAADGDIVVDTTASKIWVRVGGTWKGVVVA